MNRQSNENCRKDFSCGSNCVSTIPSNAISLANAIRHRTPDARAVIRGGNGFDEICGTVLFYQQKFSVFVVADISNLPKSDKYERIFAFHIHNKESCTGNGENEFANVKSHYNPDNKQHPYHKGDLPPLFGNDGKAFSAFLTDRFTVKEIVGKTVIIHSSTDDFTTQPSGNSGEMIACGEIKRIIEY